MPKYRITLDVESYDNPTRLLFPAMQEGVVAVDELDTSGGGFPRSIILRRRATTHTDTPGDFLPNTDSCEGGSILACPNISVVLVSWSDGGETRLCHDHLLDQVGMRFSEVEAR